MFSRLQYENMPMQHQEIFYVVKKKGGEIFSRKCLIVFLFLLKT